MVDMTIEDFCKTYQANPKQALEALQGITEEDAAAILIDAGGVISEVSLLNDGISRLELAPIALTEIDISSQARKTREELIEFYNG